MNVNLTSDPVLNTQVLQTALDKGGIVRVEDPGSYEVEGPLWIGSHTALIFGPGVVIRRSEGGQSKPFIVNKGLFKGEWNDHIRIEGLHLVTNGVDLTHFSIYPGLRGHLAFLKVRDLVIRDYECCDLTKLGYGIHICTFEDILLEQLHIEGDKDGVHLSDGRYFTIRDSSFRTYDDAIALNAYDYCLSTAVYGDVEDGLIENCHDHAGNSRSVGYFCRMLGGAWTDWSEGMRVQNSTLAVYDGHLYSVCLPLPPEKREKDLISTVPPTHKYGVETFGGIPWRYVREHRGTYEATVRRITCRNIYLHKPRVGFGFTVEGGLWSESVPAGVKLPVIEDLVFDRILVECDPIYVFGGGHPVRNVRVSNSTLRGNILATSVYQNHKAEEYPPLDITFTGVHIPRSEGVFLLQNVAERPVDIQVIACSGDGFPEKFSKK